MAGKFKVPLCSQVEHNWTNELEEFFKISQPIGVKVIHNCKFERKFDVELYSR